MPYNPHTGGRDVTDGDFFGYGLGYRDADIAVALVGGNPDNVPLHSASKINWTGQGKDTGSFEADVEAVTAGEIFWILPAGFSF